jgi:hypothetical protein
MFGKQRDFFQRGKASHIRNERHPRQFFVPCESLFALSDIALLLVASAINRLRVSFSQPML